MFGIGFPISNSFVLYSFKGLLIFSVGQSGGRYTLIITILRFFMCMSWYSTYELKMIFLDLISKVFRIRDIMSHDFEILCDIIDMS